MREDLETLGRRLAGNARLTKPYDRGVGTAYCRLRMAMEHPVPGHSIMSWLVEGEGAEVRGTWGTDRTGEGRMPNDAERLTGAINGCQETFGYQPTLDALELIVAELEAGYRPPYGINARSWHTIEAPQ